MKKAKCKSVSIVVNPSCKKEVVYENTSAHLCKRNEKLRDWLPRNMKGSEREGNDNGVARMREEWHFSNFYS